MPRRKLSDKDAQALVLEPGGGAKDGAWMEALSAENWQELAADLTSALALPRSEDAGVELKAALHEWRESMTVLSDPRLVRSMAQARRVAGDPNAPRIPVTKPGNTSSQR